MARKIHGQSFRQFCREHDPVLVLNETLLERARRQSMVSPAEFDNISRWQLRSSAGKLRRKGVLTPDGKVAFNNINVSGFGQMRRAS